LGNRRQGDAAFLKEQGMAYGFALNVLSPVSAGSDSVSSTRIRAALARGDVREVNLCLGRPFQIIGTLMGPRTVQAPAQHEMPAPGVYRVQVCGEPDWATISDCATTNTGNDVGDKARMMTLRNAPRCEWKTPNHIVVDFLS
jgi:FAD synthase